MCWSSREAMHNSWSRDVHQRTGIARADVRVSDAERDDVVQQLSRHTADGRLTLDEFEERVEEAFRAKTRRELDASLRSLPRPPVRAARRPDVAARMRPLYVIALIAIAVVAMGSWVLWIAIPVAWCRVTGRRRHQRWREVDPGRHHTDELTLV